MYGSADLYYTNCLHPTQPDASRPREGARDVNRARARRFRMQVAVAYRERGHDDWIDAHTINLSRTGLLMQCRSVPPVGAPIDVLLTLGPPLATISCSARVVRAELSAHSGDWRVAARIHRYTFLSKPTPDSNGAA
jgi:hypothetical protein